MDKALLARMKIKPEHSLLVLNSPAGYVKPTDKVDTRLTLDGKYHAIKLFVKDKHDLDAYALKVVNALKDDGLLWICYPKKSAAIKTDLTRDNGWDALKKQGYEGVSLVSVDDTWSAFRFRPTEKVKTQKKQHKAAARKAFTALLEKPSDGKDTAFISIPFDVEETYGTKGQVKVKALFDGYPYRGVLANMGTGGHILIVRKDIRSAIGKKVGDTVRVELMEDTEERTIEVPLELLTALSKNTKAKNFFDSLSFTNRKEYANWIRNAKKEDTRQKRLKEAIEKLVKGMKNPGEK